HESFASTTVATTSTPVAVDCDDLLFDLALEARGTWETTIRVALRHSDLELEPVHEQYEESEPEASRVLRKWQDEVPRLHSDSDFLVHMHRRSIVDMAALRLHAEVEGNEYSLPAAGLPWFMSIFGR